MVGEQVARIAELEVVVGELRLRLGQNSEAPWMIVDDSGLPASAGSSSEQGFFAPYLAETVDCFGTPQVIHRS